jgi:hypothetical protein
MPKELVTESSPRSTLWGIATRAVNAKIDSAYRFIARFLQKITAAIPRIEITRGGGDVDGPVMEGHRELVATG